MSALQQVLLGGLGSGFNGSSYWITYPEATTTNLGHATTYCTNSASYYIFSILQSSSILLNFVQTDGLRAYAKEVTGGASGISGALSIGNSELIAQYGTSTISDLRFINYSNSNQNAQSVIASGGGLGSVSIVGVAGYSSGYYALINNGFTSTLYLLHYNSSRSLTWARAISDATSEASITTTASGNALLCLERIVSSSNRVELLSINSSGTLDAETRLVVNGDSTGVTTSSIPVVDASGNIHVAVVKSSIYIIKLTSGLSYTSAVSISGANLSINALAVASDGTYYLGGSVSGGGAVVLRVNTDLTIPWYNRLYKTSPINAGSVLCGFLDESENAFVCGGSYAGTSYYRPFMAKFNTDGSGTGTYTDFTYASSSGPTAAAPSGMGVETSGRTVSSVTLSSGTSSLIYGASGSSYFGTELV